MHSAYVWCIIQLYNYYSMKLIDVPLYLQTPGSIDCGPACIQMLYDHFLGKKIDIEEVKKQLDYTEVGTTLYQNGSQLLKEGLKVTAISANPLVFPGNTWDQLKTNEDVREYIQKKYDDSYLDDHFKLIYRTLLQFIDDGGDFKVKIPDFNDIKDAIDRDAIVCALNYTQPLGENEGTFHFVLVTGYDEGRVFINNSWPLSQKQAWFPIDKFLFAVHSSALGDADNASFLIVSK